VKIRAHVPAGALGDMRGMLSRYLAG
jgi:hypothetical protein